MNNSENNNVILYKIHSINLCIDSAKDDYTKILYLTIKKRVVNVHIIIDKRGGILYNNIILNGSCTIIY